MSRTIQQLDGHGPFRGLHSRGDGDVQQEPLARHGDHRAGPSGYINRCHSPVLDAAWSQYHSRFGDPAKFVAHDVAMLKSKRVALIVGLNILKGNGGRMMTPTQVKSWGGALLNNSYPCAFISWKYSSSKLSGSAHQSAMSYLRSKAQNRSAKSCKG